MERKVVEFKGTKFYSGKDKYFRSFKNPKTKYLHRAIWEDTFGEIPKNYHIHHKDGNKFNNSIENLDIIHRAEHLSFHQKLYCENNPDKVKEHMDKIRPLASKWHKTKEAKIVHSKAAKLGWENSKPKYDCKCIVCGTKYKSYR